MPSINPIRLARTAVTAPARLAHATVVTTTRVGVRAIGAVASQVVRRPHVAVPSDRVAPEPVTPDADEPVNVVEELDLDPAPVDRAATAAAPEEPVTGIDAAADTEHVEATPADVAARVERGPGSGPGSA